MKNQREKRGRYESLLMWFEERSRSIEASALKIVCLASAVILSFSLLFSYVLHRTNEVKVGFLAMICFGFSASMFASFVFFFLEYFVRKLKIDLEAIKSQDKSATLHSIQEGIDRLKDAQIQIPTLFTDDGKFETVLCRVAGFTNSSAKWVASRFISEKVNMAFRKDMTGLMIPGVWGVKYAQLVGHILSECTDSVYYTCLYSPVKWFIELSKDYGKIDHHKMQRYYKLGTGELKIDFSLNMPSADQYLLRTDLPEHERILQDRPYLDKRRLIILNDVSLAETFCPINMPFYKAFKDIALYQRSPRSNTVEVRFITESKIDDFVGEETSASIEMFFTDFGLYDRDIVIMWKNIRKVAYDSSLRELLLDVPEECFEECFETTRNVPIEKYQKMKKIEAGDLEFFFNFDVTYQDIFKWAFDAKYEKFFYNWDTMEVERTQFVAENRQTCEECMRMDRGATGSHLSIPCAALAAGRAGKQKEITICQFL